MSKLKVDVRLTRGHGESRFPLVAVTAAGRNFTEAELNAIRKTSLIDELRALPAVYDASVVSGWGEVRAVIQSDASAEDFYRVVQATLAEHFEIQNTTRVAE